MSINFNFFRYVQNWVWVVRFNFVEVSLLLRGKITRMFGNIQKYNKADALVWFEYIVPIGIIAHWQYQQEYAKLHQKPFAKKIILAEKSTKYQLISSAPGG